MCVSGVKCLVSAQAQRKQLKKGERAPVRGGRGLRDSNKTPPLRPVSKGAPVSCCSSLSCSSRLLNRHAVRAMHASSPGHRSHGMSGHITVGAWVPHLGWIDRRARGSLGALRRSSTPQRQAPKHIYIAGAKTQSRIYSCSF